MKTVLKALWISLFVFSSCSNDDNKPMDSNTYSPCLIHSVTKYNPNNYLQTNFEYDSDNRLVSMKKYNLQANNLLDSRTEIANTTDSSVSKVDVRSKRYSSVEKEVGILTEYAFDPMGYAQTLPSSARQHLTYYYDDRPSESQLDVKDYAYTYDARHRVIKVVETSKNKERMEVFYNEKNNVTSIKFTNEYSAPPSVAILEVTSYDDRPNPYVTMPYWKFVSGFFGLEYESLVALSQNNPLDYTYYQNGELLSSRKITYSYNETGFPFSQTYINKNKDGDESSPFTEAYTYVCK